MSRGAETLEALVARAEDLADPGARELCRELVQQVLDLHRTGLERMVTRMGGEPLRAVLRDELVRALFLLHDLRLPEPAPGAPRDLIPAESLVRRKHTSSRERCSLCAEPLAAEHPHLVERAHRAIICACQACCLLLSDRADGQYRRIVRRATRLAGFRMSEEVWSALGVPVGLAFLSMASLQNEVIAAYPGPAGAVEAPVDRRAWDALVADNPVLRELEPDIEALLVHRAADARDYLLVSIDVCYHLTGLVRSRWQGISGGEAIAQVVRDFVGSLEQAAPDASSSRSPD
jgi:hypothetical protein